MKVKEVLPKILGIFHLCTDLGFYDVNVQ